MKYRNIELFKTTKNNRKKRYAQTMPKKQQRIKKIREYNKIRYYIIKIYKIYINILYFF